MRSIMLIAFALCAAAGCSKYEDGPPLSLRSRTERLSNNWVVSSALHNGTDGTADFNAQFSDYLLSIGKDEQYTLTYELVPVGSHVEKGSWKFSDDKRHVVFTDTNGNVHDYTILRLKEHELWVVFQDANSTTWEVHLVPKS